MRAAREGYAVYVWHCDREVPGTRCTPGRPDATYLRGVQATDANGRVTFTSIFPRLLPRWLAAHPLRGLPSLEGVEPRTRT